MAKVVRRKLVRKEVKASELPVELRKELDAAPGETVRVTLDVRPRRDAGRLIEITRRASAEAKGHGLTRRKLADLLDDP